MMINLRKMKMIKLKKTKMIKVRKMRMIKLKFQTIKFIHALLIF